MKKDVLIGYIWECPICHQTSKGAWRCRYTARRHGIMHVSQVHQGSKLPPIIKDWSLLKKQAPGKPPNNGEKMEHLKKGQFWYEVECLPSFTIKPIELLRIPGHVFVSERVYSKICKQGD